MPLLEHLDLHYPSAAELDLGTLTDLKSLKNLSIMISPPNQLNQLEWLQLHPPERFAGLTSLGLTRLCLYSLSRYLVCAHRHSKFLPFQVHQAGTPKREEI